VRQLLDIPRIKHELATKPRRKTKKLWEKWGEWVQAFKCPTAVGVDSDFYFSPSV
jgi:hypothetical protein